MRERMVGRSAAGRWQTRRRTARAGRLLEDLEERVGGGGVELVGGVDDGDAAAAVGGAEVEEAGERADLVDGDGGAQALGLVVPGAAAEEELRRGEGGEPAEDRVARRHVEGRGGLAGDQVAGDAPGEGGLAGAGRAGDRPGVVQPAGGGGFEEARLGGLLAEEDSGLARVRRAGQAVGLVGGGAHAGHRGGDAGGDRLGVAVGGDDAAAGGELGGEREEALAQPGLEVVAHALEAVLAPPPRARPRASASSGARSRTRVRSGSIPMASVCSASTMGRRPARATPW